GTAEGTDLLDARRLRPRARANGADGGAALARPRHDRGLAAAHGRGDARRRPRDQGRARPERARDATAGGGIGRSHAGGGPGPPRHRSRTDRLAVAGLRPGRRLPDRPGGPGGGRSAARDSPDTAGAVAPEYPGGRRVTRDHPNHKWWTLFAMCFALFMIMLDNTVVNVALPSIQRSLNITNPENL